MKRKKLLFLASKAGFPLIHIQNDKNYASLLIQISFVTLFWTKCLLLQVDSGQKLVELCGTAQTNIKTNFPCVIITKYRDSSDTSSDDSSSSTLSPIEQTLTDFYECTIQEFPRPIIELPGWDVPISKKDKQGSNFGLRTWNNSNFSAERYWNWHWKISEC